MANLSYIDTEKSIAAGRLSLNLNTFDRVEQITDTVVWSTLCLALIFYPTLAYFHVDIKSSNDKAVAFILFPLIILVGLYGLYRKLNENKLIGVDTPFAGHKNKEYLLEFLKQRGYEVFRESKNVVIVNVEESLSFNNLYTKMITFIIDDQKIYFTMVKKFPIINPPVILSHFCLKADLKKFFKVKQTFLD